MTGNRQANVRAFIAVELPPQVHALLSTVQSEFREMMGSAAGGVRWVRPEGTHLTLQFLGDVPRDSIQGIQEELRKAAAGISPFTLEVTGVGAFPSTRRPRVIWVGLDGDKQHVASLQRLQQSVAAGMQGLGFKPDHSFKPHLTLGRVRENASASELDGICNTLQYPQTRPAFATEFSVHGVSLMQSDLNPGGAVYTQLAHFPLGQQA